MMERQSLRNKLFNSYSSHYLRVNDDIDKDDKKNYDSYDVMFGGHLIGLQENSLVLDVGCGAGLLLRYLEKYKNLNLVGIDISEEQVSISRKMVSRAEISCVEAIEFLSPRPNTFKGIFCLDVIEHIENKDECYAFVKAMYDGLQPKGFCIIRTPNAANLTGCYSRYMDLTHEQIFTQTSLMQLMETSGFIELKIIPIRSSYLGRRFRLFIEKQFHRIIYRICGRGNESEFTSNIVIAGRK